MIVLALDVGAKRIGVAVSDELELLASPRGIIRRQSTAQALAAIERAVSEAGAGLVVVGLPISFDGQLHTQAHTIQAFAEQLRKRLQLPLVYADETLSSVRAEEQLRAAGVRPERIRERLDAAAAAVILQDYLDQRRAAQPSASTLTPQRATPDVECDEAQRDEDARSQDVGQTQLREVAPHVKAGDAPQADTPQPDVLDRDALDETEEIQLP